MATGVTGLMKKKVLNQDSTPNKNDVSYEGYDFREALGDIPLCRPHLHTHTHTGFHNLCIKCRGSSTPFWLWYQLLCPLERGPTALLRDFLFKSDLKRYCCKLMYIVIIWCNLLMILPTLRRTILYWFYVIGLRFPS